MLERDIAYTAGLVDGEGCITIHQRPGRNYIELFITNTDPRMIGWLHERWGGAATWLYPTNPRHKPRGKWEVAARQAAAILPIIRPYLIVKAAQADLALAYQATMGRQGTRIVPPAQRAERDRLFTVMRGLNRKGPIDKMADG